MLVCVPVAFVPASAFPFDPPKAVLLRAGALALVACLAVRPAELARRLRHPGSIGTWQTGALAFGGIVVVSSLAGVDPVRAVVGSVGRAMGASTWLAGLVVFWAIAARARDLPRRSAVAWAALAGGVPVALYGALQAVGADPWRWQGDPASVVGSTVGRSNFLGDYLAMLLVLALAVLGAARSRPERWVLGGLGALYGAVLVLTAARAAWIGAGLGIATIVLIRGWHGGIQHRWSPATLRRPASAVALALGCAAVALAAGLVSPTATSVMLRLATLAPWHPASAGTRTTTWAWSLKLIGDRPLLGYGADVAGLAFPSLWSGVRIDRAHDWILDLALQFGLVGLVSYAVLVWLAVREVPRTLRHADERDAAVLSGALGALAAFWGATLLSFGVVTTCLVHWALLGMLAAAAGTVGRVAPRAAWVPAAVLAAGLAVQASALLADVSALRATTGPIGSQAAVAEARRALDLAPYRAEYAIALARSIVGASTAHGTVAPGRRGAALQEAGDLADRATAMAPGDAYTWLAAGEVYRALGAFGGGGDAFDRAARAFATALELDARLAEAESGWGLSEHLRGNRASAIAHYRAALALDEAHADTYRRLGDVLLEAGDDHGAAESFARAIGNAPGMTAAYVGHARALCRSGKRDEGLRRLEEARSMPGYGPASGEVALRDCAR